MTTDTLIKTQDAAKINDTRKAELLKQPQYQPMPIEEQVASIYAGTQGFLDSVDTKDVVRYEAAMLIPPVTRRWSPLTRIPSVPSRVIDKGQIGRSTAPRK